MTAPAEAGACREMIRMEPGVDLNGEATTLEEKRRAERKSRALIESMIAMGFCMFVVVLSCSFEYPSLEFAPRKRLSK